MTRARQPRVELNIEKWPAIWRPAKSKSRPVSRILERQIESSSAGSITARVEVGFTHLGQITTEDQKTYYALVDHWERSGRPDAQVSFSMRGLARALRKHWGTNVMDSMTGSMRRLRATPITWFNAYRERGTNTVLEQIDMFTILSELKIVRTTIDGHVTREAGYYRFNDFTLRNLRANHTKPVLLDTILGFRSEAAQLLYTHIDLILSNKVRYERRSRDLLADIGLTNHEYDRVYERKRVLERALKELQGVSLTTGILRSATIERTQDGTDYKVVFVKTGRTDRPAPTGAGESALPTPVKSPLGESAEELVYYFHKRCHGLDRVFLQSKEIEQATCLIAQHGPESARYIVEYALSQAPKTGYRPQTFGGILHYSSQALRAYENISRRPALPDPNPESKPERAGSDQNRRARAEAFLAQCPPERYQVLRNTAKAELIHQMPWIAGHEGKTSFERVLRNRILARLTRPHDWQPEPTQTA